MPSVNLLLEFEFYDRFCNEGQSLDELNCHVYSITSLTYSSKEKQLMPIAAYDELTMMASLSVAPNLYLVPEVY